MRNLEIISLLTVGIIIVLIPVCAGPATIDLPQTGQARCYDDWNTEIACIGTGQDGEIQAGAAWPAPRFTDNGDGTITDGLTGLTWLKDANCLHSKYPGFDQDLSGQTNWETKGDGAVTWQHALDFVAGMNSGTYPQCSQSQTGWRLPNVLEMESLAGLDLGSAGNQTVLDFLQNNGFNSIETHLYWLSTTDAESTATGWTMDMEFGWVVYDAKTWPHFVWPVRGGAKGPPNPTYPANVRRTGQTATYAAGDDGAAAHGVNWPAPRFTDPGDGTVTDTLTGLMWLKDANCMASHYASVDQDTVSSSPGNGTVTWQHALDFVATINSGIRPLCAAGYADWRLPNRKELHSLIDYGQFNPALPTAHPFSNVELLYYWTSTNDSDTREAWFVDLGHGQVLKDFKSVYSAEKWVWPVRGGLRATTAMAAPAAQQTFSYASPAIPAWSKDPAQAQPMATGTVSAGGSTVSMAFNVGGFLAPVDLYVALYAPAIDPLNVYLIKPDLSLQPLSQGLAAWQTNAAGSVNQKLYGDLPASFFPSGTYTLALLATASGDPSRFYLWVTAFAIP